MRAGSPAQARDGAGVHAARRVHASLPCSVINGPQHGGRLNQIHEAFGLAQRVGALDQRQLRIRAVLSVDRLQAGQHLRQQTRAIIAFGGHTQTPAQGFALGRQPAHQRIARRQRQAQRGGPVHVRAGRRLPQFRHHPRQRAGLVQHVQHARRLDGHEAARQFLPHALGHQRVGLAGLDHAAAQRQRLGRDAEIGEARREAAQPQDAHGVFLEGLAHVAEHARAQVGLAAQRVDQLAIGLARNGVDGEIAAAQIVFQRHVDTGMEGEALVAVAGLALGAGERVFLFGARMQEHRKIAAHGHEAPARHILGRGADHDQS